MTIMTDPTDKAEMVTDEVLDPRGLRDAVLYSLNVAYELAARQELPLATWSVAGHLTPGREYPGLHGVIIRDADDTAREGVRRWAAAFGGEVTETVHGSFTHVQTTFVHEGVEFLIATALRGEPEPER